LKHHFEGKWVVENVRPYYQYLIKPSIILQRHPFWANFEIKDKVFEKDNIKAGKIQDFQEKHGFDLSSYKLKDKRQVLRNCVSPEIGKHIFECMIDG